MNRLTLADEIIVLVLDDDTGEIDPGYQPVASIAVAAGVLMELALQARIDTDLTRLFLIDATPTGDALLDATLEEIAAEPEPHSSAWWIDRLSLRQDDLLGQILARLVSAGILREEERSFLWVFSHRAYPQATGEENREAKARLRALLFNDDVPEPRDTLLLGLANAIGALSQILTEEERELCSERIAGIVALEEIGRSVSAICNEIWEVVVPAAVAYPH